MPSRHYHTSYSFSNLTALPTTNEYTVHQTTSSKSHSQYVTPLEFDRTTYCIDDSASVGSSLSDDVVGEEEIFVHLNTAALAAIPRRLQKSICQMYAERFERLKKENPDLRIMPADYWIKPVASIGKKPIYFNRVPTPLYLARQTSARQSSAAHHQSVDRVKGHHPTLYSLGPGHRYRWVAQWSNIAGESPSSNLNTQMPQGHAVPSKEFRVLNGYRQPVPPNMVINHKLRKRSTGQASGLKSLSIKPVASNLRARLKRSLSRLNKWIKSES